MPVPVRCEAGVGKQLFERYIEILVHDIWGGSILEE
jgi:hypothetical protein